MRKLAFTLVALALMLSTSAYAAEVVSGTVLPPTVYDHVPSMPIEEHVLSFEQVTAKCRQLGLDQHLTWSGCANRDTGTCVIYRVADARVRRHEYGHCNGWAPNHTVAVTQKPAADPYPMPRVELKPWPVNPGEVETAATIEMRSRHIREEVELIAGAIRRTPWNTSN
jgi:hypothetical protein